MHKKGKFIVLEGLDGSGKTTQAQILRDNIVTKLEGQRASLTREPSDSMAGALCRNAVKGTLLLEPESLGLLFAADRIEHIKKEIMPQLEAGIHVVCDRYYYSNFAYQSIDGGLDLVMAYNTIPLELLRPDITFFINLSPEDCAKRMSANRTSKEMFDNIKTAKKVYSGYTETFNKLSPYENIKIIDC